jgi:ABC-type glucose/galactose transport system permease subunit
MLRGTVLLLALAFCAPTLWAALVDHTISLDQATVRFLIAVPVAAVLLAALRGATRRRSRND